MWGSSRSILGPLLFLVYINDLHCASKYCEVHHFADNTNLMNFQTSIKTINKQINDNLKNLSNSPNANKVALNVSKKRLGHELKIKPNVKKLYETDSVKYLGIHLD